MPAPVDRAFDAPPLGKGANCYAFCHAHLLLSAFSAAGEKAEKARNSLWFTVINRLGNFKLSNSLMSSNFNGQRPFKDISHVHYNELYPHRLQPYSTPNKKAPFPRP
jgi:hypothetical protein